MTLVLFLNVSKWTKSKTAKYRNHRKSVEKGRFYLHNIKSRPFSRYPLEIFHAWISYSVFPNIFRFLKIWKISLLFFTKISIVFPTFSFSQKRKSEMMVWLTCLFSTFCWKPIGFIFKTVGLTAFPRNLHVAKTGKTWWQCDVIYGLPKRKKLVSFPFIRMCQIDGRVLKIWRWFV